MPHLRVLRTLKDMAAANIGVDFLKGHDLTTASCCLDDRNSPNGGLFLVLNVISHVDRSHHHLLVTIPVMREFLQLLDRADELADDARQAKQKTFSRILASVDRMADYPGNVSSNLHQPGILDIHEQYKREVNSAYQVPKHATTNISPNVPATQARLSMERFTQAARKPPKILRTADCARAFFKGRMVMQRIRYSGIVTKNGYKAPFASISFASVDGSSEIIMSRTALETAIAILPELVENTLVTNHNPTPRHILRAALPGFVRELTEAQKCLAIYQTSKNRKKVKEKEKAAAPSKKSPDKPAGLEVLNNYSLAALAAKTLKEYQLIQAEIQRRSAEAEKKKAGPHKIYIRTMADAERFFTADMFGRADFHFRQALKDSESWAHFTVRDQRNILPAGQLFISPFVLHELTQHMSSADYALRTLSQVEASLKNPLGLIVWGTMKNTCVALNDACARMFEFMPWRHIDTINEADSFFSADMCRKAKFSFKGISRRNTGAIFDVATTENGVSSESKVSVSPFVLQYMVGRLSSLPVKMALLRSLPAGKACSYDRFNAAVIGTHSVFEQAVTALKPVVASQSWHAPGLSWTRSFSGIIERLVA